MNNPTLDQFWKRIKKHKWRYFVDDQWRKIRNQFVFRKDWPPCSYYDNDPKCHSWSLEKPKFIMKVKVESQKI